PLVVGFQRIPQPIYLCCHVRGSLGPGLRWPKFLDHQVGAQGGLRIHVLRQDFQQLPELALGCEARASQNSLDLLADGVGLHSPRHSIMQQLRSAWGTADCLSKSSDLFLPRGQNRPSKMANPGDTVRGPKDKSWDIPSVGYLAPQVPSC